MRFKLVVSTILALTSADMSAHSQPALTACDDSLLGKIAPDQMITNCTAVIDGGVIRGDELASAYFERGTSYAMKRQLSVALKDFDEAIRLKPDFAAAISQRGTIYGEMDEPARAVQDFDLAIKLDPTKAGGFANRGVAHAKLGQLQLAIEDFSQAIKLEPDNAVDFENRGNAYATIGQFDRAIQDYDQALKLEPALTEARSMRCHALIDAGRKPDESCPVSAQTEPAH